MKRILFVDDERAILDGLRNLLRRHRKEWEMVFALGGAAALAECAKAPFDVVVSDMRMPEMDGPTLLGHVRRDYPMTARIVLSGYADPEAVARALSVANQFLSKPCDVETLRGVVQRACDLHEHISDPATRGLLGGLDKLPSVPRTYWELTTLLARPETSAAEVAGVIERDTAMTAKLMQLSNSPFFGSGQRVTSVKHAVSFLGTELVRALSLSAHIFGIGESIRIDGFSLEHVQENSLTTAQLCRRFVTDRARSEEAYTAGLIHDAGQFALAAAAPERYAAVIAEVRASGRTLHEVERELLGTSHAEAGAYMLGMWGLPLPIVEAVAYHHRPGRCSAQDTQVLAAVHVADVLADGGSDFDLEFLARTGRTAELERWRAIADPLRQPA